MSATTIAEAPKKPLLRGVSHQVAFWVSLAAGALLVYRASSARAAIASAVYGVSMATLYGTSALYHRPNWSPAARQRMRRLDHAAIFVLIAGSYTPLFLLAPAPIESRNALLTAWIGAALGVAKSLLWIRAPKALSAGVYVAYGWVLCTHVAPLVDRMGPACFGFLLASGIVYSLGALIYALRRPDPLPAVFGYHEVFHALVIAAGVSHFTHVVLVMRLFG